MKNNEENRKRLLRGYHAECRRLKLTESDKEALKAAYNVESSAELTADQLAEIIGKLKGNTQTDKADLWRKRVMAAVGGYLRSRKQAENSELIKSIACRAACCSNFNQIPVAKLRTVYNEFLNKKN